MAPRTESEIEPDLITLNNLAGGALPELFAQELQRVLTNILDPNTEAEAKRSIRIDITFEPNPERTSCSHYVEVSSKVAPFNGAAGFMFVGRRRGEAVAVVNRMEQTQLRWDAESAPKPLPSAPNAQATGS